MLKKGDILDDRYLIDDQIGAGGTSTVFRAFDLNADRSERAVKEIHGSPEEIQEKIAESMLMAELSRSNTKYSFIPNIIHRVKKGDALFIVMDYINGVDMSETLTPESPVPPNKVIEYSKDICSFMSFMHEKHYIFSDMKPENIMILRNDESSSRIADSKKFSSLKFIDFGATISEGGDTTAFTPSYAAPEQFLSQFEDVLPDRRTDIFNIGATIFHMATGYAPENVFTGSGEDRNDLKPSYERFTFPQKGSIGPGLKKIIMKCVADDRNQRYSSCSEIIADLEKLTEKKHKIISAVLLMISVLLAFSGTFSLLKYSIQKESMYNEYIESAQKTTSAENKIKYLTEAINTMPENNETYMMLLEACSYDQNENDEPDDMYFTEDEIRNVREIIASNKNRLIKSGTYGKLEYEIGKLIWFYSTRDSETKRYEENERTNMKASLSYFEEALEYKENSLSEEECRLAEIYYHIADFCSNYQKRIENGDRNEPLSLYDFEFLADLTDFSDCNDYVRLASYYFIIDMLDESLPYYENESADSIHAFYNRIYNDIHKCGTTGIPSADSDIQNTVSALCQEKIQALNK